MKAARLYGSRDVRIEDIEEPEPGAQELKIKVRWFSLPPAETVATQPRFSVTQAYLFFSLYVIRWHGEAFFQSREFVETHM